MAWRDVTYVIVLVATDFESSVTKRGASHLCKTMLLVGVTNKFTHLPSPQESRTLLNHTELSLASVSCLFLMCFQQSSPWELLFSH